MTHAEMENEFCGTRNLVGGGRVNTRRERVNLFLPSAHHVESVHLTTSSRFGGKPLHPLLGIVQTPAREYYVLRENGMQVGVEEDGVAEVWRNLLSCDELGVMVRE